MSSFCSITTNSTFCSKIPPIIALYVLALNFGHLKDTSTSLPILVCALSVLVKSLS